jgi:type II secretory pathway component PulC
MKSSVWILNSIVVLIVFTTILYIAFSLKYITQQPTIKPLNRSNRSETAKKDELKPKDSRFIYENDLFGTFQPTITKPIALSEELPILPKPPVPKPVAMQITPPVQFLPALPITITGIDWASNEVNSRISIVNNNTKESALYKMGDTILDAHIVRILENKVILIRSNGQQEVLYRKASDAEAEIKEIKDPTWTTVVQKQSESRYLVDPKEFVSHVHNLASFIDMLNATTARKNSIAIGCRIGKMNPTSLGFALGFIPGDIIKSVNTIEPTDTAKRVEIYNTLAALELGSKIKVDIIRFNKTITLEYVLHSFSQPSMLPSANKQPPNTIKNISPLELQALTPQELAHEDSRATPTAQKYKKQDTAAIAQFGKKDALLKQIS